MAFHTYRRWFAAAAPAEGKGFAAVDVGVTAKGRGCAHDATGEIAGTVDGGNSRLHTPYYRRRRCQQIRAAPGGAASGCRRPRCDVGPSRPAGTTTAGAATAAT